MTPRPPDSNPDWLLAGQVGRPHGFDGSFYVIEPRPSLLSVGVRVSIDGGVQRISRRAGSDLRPIVALETISDRTAAQTLQGKELLILRTDAPALGPDEWWIEDLERCVVWDGERQVGRVRRLMALPSCEVLEVERVGDAGDLLVPLIGDAVREVDVARRLIDVDLGFLGEA